MERRQLEYFVAVAEQGGFGRASVALNVTQSAISQAIAQLESELRTQLFLRTGRHAKLTAAGHAALTPARQALRDLRTIHSVVADVMGLAGGHLDIATFPPLAEWPIGPIVGAFRQSYPAVSVYVKGPIWARMPEVVEMVRDGRCELGFIQTEDLPNGLLAYPLAPQDYVAVLPPASSVGNQGTVRLTDLVAQGLIVGPWWETSPPFFVLESSHPELVSRAIAVRIEYREAYVPLVVSGAGAAILPRYVGTFAAAAGAIVAELDVPIHLKASLVQREGDLAPAAREFRDLALQLFGVPGETAEQAFARVDTERSGFSGDGACR